MKGATNRILTIDIMRGLTIFLMLFVNDLYVSGVPSWMVHAKADHDGMGLADWVFPGFLFMVGLSIPYAVEARKKKGDTPQQLLFHITGRTLSLLIIGLVMLNGEEMNPDLTGMPQLLWQSLSYVCVFLIWNAYPKNSNYRLLFRLLQLAGAIGLVYLLFIYKAGTPGNEHWLQTGWWGILGLIGWGYLTAALAYLFTADRWLRAAAAWAFFLLLNMLSQSGHIHIEGIIQQVFGVIIDGNVPSIVLAGLVSGIVIRKHIYRGERLLFLLVPMGIGSLVTGFILRHWFIISKIYGTPSWAMICNGISLLVFALVYWIVDVKKHAKWASLFEIAGRNSLTTYLAPDLVYFACWSLGIPLFFYKQDHNVWLAVSGSIMWALLMIPFTYLLSKLYIRLKL